MKKLSKFILKLAGWSIQIQVSEPAKSIICVAPHTSNWDFAIGKLSYMALGREASFLIKKSWFFFPMNLFFNAIGGVAIDRSKKSSVTDQMAEEFAKRSSFHLAITPEGTRSLAERWKMGFYHIAKKANVPIQLAYIDYAKKEMGVMAIFTPTDNEEQDFKTIEAYYKGITARYPSKFNLTETKTSIR